MSATFAELAPYLADFGYPPVPIKPGGKGPMRDDWQAGHPPEHYLPDCASWGVGILTATTPAIDLDIRDRGLVKILIRLAEDMLDPGPSPLRVGQFPKALLPFSTATPFPKMTTRWFALPGEDFTAAGFKGHRVEVLADGQQFVAYAVHPGTGRPYKWARGSPLTYHAIDLAPIEQAQAAAFVEAAERIMLGAGMIPLQLGAGRFRLDIPETEPPPPPRRQHRPGDPETIPVWQVMTPGEIARRLDPETAHLEHGKWRLRCPVHRGESNNSLCISKGDDQLTVWHCFAGCSQAAIAATIARIIR